MPFYMELKLFLSLLISKVQFARNVFPEKIEIYETFQAGAVIKIQVMQPDSKLFTLWESNTDQHITTARIFAPTLKVSYL